MAFDHYYLNSDIPAGMSDVNDLIHEEFEPEQYTYDSVTINDTWPN
jgi:hypothetical protein